MSVSKVSSIEDSSNLLLENYLKMLKKRIYGLKLFTLSFSFSKSNFIKNGAANGANIETTYFDYNFIVYYLA